jgi:hypothetical protein
MSRIVKNIKSSTVKIIDDSSQYTISLKTPTSIQSDLIFTLPDTHGLATTLLTTAGPTGVLSWAAPSAFTNILATNITTSSLILNNAGTRTTFLRSANGTSHYLAWPNSTGVTGTFLLNDGNGTLTWATPPIPTNLMTTNSTTTTFVFNNSGTRTTFLRANFGTSHNLTFPNSQGAANSVLTNNGLGLLSWNNSIAYILSDTGSNTIGGTGSGLSISSGINNTIFGASSGTAITTTINNYLFGCNSGKDAISYNILFGDSTGTNIDSSVCIGSLSNGSNSVNIGKKNKTSLSVNIGYNIMESIVPTSNIEIICIGNYSCNKVTDTSSTYCICIGSYTVSNSYSVYNLVAIGYKSLNGTALGFIGSTIAIGYMTGTNAYGANFKPHALLGSKSGINITNGTDNILIGYSSGSTITTGSNNINIGYEAGKNITTGIGNICIGYQSGTATSSTSNSIVIGNNSSADSNCIVIGNNINGTQSGGLYIAHRLATGGLPANWLSTKELFEFTSSIKFKKDIQNYIPDNNFDKLRPVLYNYKNDSPIYVYQDNKDDENNKNKNNRKYVGFIAEEIVKLYPEYVVLGTDKNDKEFYQQPYGVSYNNMTTLLVHELNKLQNDFDNDINDINKLMKELKCMY